MNDEQLQELKEDLRATLQAKVNGKIDDLKRIVLDHNERHEEDMLDVREHMARSTPVIEAFEEWQTTRKTLGNVGNSVKWLAGLATAVGVLWIIVRQWLTGK